MARKLPCKNFGNKKTDKDPSMTEVHRRCFLALLTSTLLTLAPLVSYGAPPTYSVTRLGLEGDGYISALNYSRTLVQFFSQNGHVAGISSRYTTYSVPWVFDGTQTIAVGLSGERYYGSENLQARSTLSLLNDHGQAAGTTRTYVDHPQYSVIRVHDNNHAWFFDGQTTKRIGLTHLYETTGQYSDSVTGINNSGQVIGRISHTYSPSNNPDSNILATKAWFYDGNTTFAIGLMGAEYSGAHGRYDSSASFINDNGVVVGRTRRYDQSTYGLDAWVYYDGETRLIPAYTEEVHFDDGYHRNSVAVAINNSGLIAGHTDRRASQTRGQDAWIYDFFADTLVQVGLVGGNHEFPSPPGAPFRHSEILALNESGMAAGVSRNSPSRNNLFTDAWFFDGAETQQIGLTGNDYTRESNGDTNSEFVALNEQGHVVGHSSRFHEDFNHTFGRDTWYFDGSTTYRIGPTDDLYSRSKDGFRSSEARHLSDSGYVAGYATRFVGDGNRGRDTWLYDLSLDETIVINLSTRHDGYAWSEIVHLGEDGSIIGSYNKYNATGTSLIGEFIFYYHQSVGAIDLGLLLDEEMDISQWVALDAAIQSNGLGYIITESIENGSRLSYILSPTEVPLPPSFSLFISAVASLAFWRRRHTKKLNEH